MSNEVCSWCLSLHLFYFHASDVDDVGVNLVNSEFNLVHPSQNVGAQKKKKKSSSETVKKMVCDTSERATMVRLRYSFANSAQIK